MKLNKITNIVVFLTFLMAFGLIAITTFWLTFPYKPIVFTETPFPVDKQTYKAGESLVYEVTYCKFTDVNPFVTRYFVNEIVYQLSSRPAMKKPIGCDRVKFSLQIPANLAPDTYYLKINYIYQINPIRQVNVEAVTQDFEIIK